MTHECSNSYRRQQTISLVRLVALLLAASFTVACSQKSKLFATWQEPEAELGPYSKVAAIALARDDATRRVAEDEFTRRLPKNTEGVTSYTVLSREDEESVERVVARLREAGADSAAVMRLVEEKNSVEYDPGSLWRPAHTFHNYYGGVWAAYADPGYLTTEIAVRVETAFYSLKDDEASLVWTGYSESLNPKSSQVVIDDVARLVVRELTRLRIVQ